MSTLVTKSNYGFYSNFDWLIIEFETNFKHLINIFVKYIRKFIKVRTKTLI